MKELIEFSILFTLLIMLSAFFSSAETAFTAISRVKLRSLVEEGVKGSKKLEYVLSYPRRLLTAILIGNNITNVAASALATTLMTEMLFNYGVDNIAAAISIVTGVMTFIILTFGEITPKTIAVKNPSRWALFISPVMFYLMIVLYPFISLFMVISQWVSKLFGMPHSDETKILTETEIRAIIQLAEEDGILEKEEKSMLDGVFKMAEKKVYEIMTPRTDTICLEASQTIEDAIELIGEKGHSRIPIFEDKIDNIVGVLYAKDLLNVESPSIPVTKFAREVVFIPETKQIEDLLQQMKRSKFHLAIVVDEYGGMAGLVTFEDIIEEIVGEVQDEYDNESSRIQKLGDAHYQIDASVDVDDLPDIIKNELPSTQEDYDTVGGFVLDALGAFPKKGDTFTYGQLEVTVTQIRKRRIISVEFKHLNLQ
jgi:CBS domain containing-hemolysin-like protein